MHACVAPRLTGQAFIVALDQEELLTSLAQLAVSDSAGVHLSADQSRAVVFVKLVELATAKGVPRPALLRFLVHALNANCLPRLPASETDSPVLAALADAVCAGAGVTQSGEALATALSAASLQPPGLTAAERAALCSGSAPSVALAALAVARSRLVVPLADGVAALSCEVCRPR
jgi:histidine ammonia-lyase